MNFKITLGQYYPVESLIHSLDPRLKLIATINIIVILFIAQGFFAHSLITLFLYLSILVSKVPIKFVLNGIKALSYFIIFTLVINLIFAPGEIEIISFWVISITLESLLWAVQTSVRLILLLISSSVLTLTTSPVALTSAIESLLSPFKKINLPVHEIAMMMTIALRFIPTLLEETDKITKAQMARGAGLDTGGIIKRAKNLIPIIVPLFVSAFKRADELALAMESRCYRGDINRTKMKELKYKKRDYMAFASLSLLTLIIIAISVVS